MEAPKEPGKPFGVIAPSKGIDNRKLVSGRDKETSLRHFWTRTTEPTVFEVEFVDNLCGHNGSSSVNQCSHSLALLVHPHEDNNHLCYAPCSRFKIITVSSATGWIVERNE